LEAQLQGGVLADGLWFEGSFSYHFYALAAILMHLKAVSSSSEFDLRGHPAVRAMLEAPVRCAYPDGTLPATNDCWYYTGLIGECCHGVPPAPAFYEVGYAWYQDIQFAQVLQRAYRHGQRNSIDALLYGAEEIPATEWKPQRSVLLPASGYAILRPEVPDGGEPVTPREQTYLLLKYGAHGGGHGHPDKLNLILYAHNRRHSVDLGTPGYGLEHSEAWYRRTISHNTMIIDGRSQPPVTGCIDRFLDHGPFKLADASASWSDGSYADVEMRRVLVARGDYFLDICTVSCGRPRRIDWIYHNMGDLCFGDDADTLVEMEGEGEGYEFLTGARKTGAEDDLVCSWLVDDGGLTLFTAGAPGAVLFTARAPGYPPTDLRGVVINRRHAAETAFLSVFCPYGRKESVYGVRWDNRQLIETGWASCTVRTRCGLERWLIRLSDPAKSPRVQLKVL
jgi:hypothetical protein